MIFIKPIWVNQKEDKRNNTVMAGHYLCFCPYCEEENITWSIDYNIKYINGTNKCRHFTKLTKNGKLVFKSKPTIKIKNNIVYIDDVNTQCKLNDLIYYMEDMLYECEYKTVNIPDFLIKSMCVTHSCFGNEFKMDRVLMIMEELKNLKKK